MARRGTTRLTSTARLPPSAGNYAEWRWQNSVVPAGRFTDARPRSSAPNYNNKEEPIESIKTYRVARFRLALVREGSVPTEWNKQVREAGDVARLMGPLAAALDREHFWTVLLDGKNRATGLNLVSIGTLTAALVHPREVFKPAIAGTAAAVVLCHNHPSGDPAPSAEDTVLTRRLCEVGDLVGIKVLDHIVLGHDGTFRSMADEGLLGGVR